MQNIWPKSSKTLVFRPKRCTGRYWKIFPTDGIWLLITSTHGAGDIPDNLQPLYDELLEQQPNLTAVRFGAVGIGSREYDTFCGAVEKVEAAIKSCGAKQIGETLKINILDHDIPEDPAEEWLGEWKNLLKND